MRADDADRCRENGWKVGTHLEGSEGYGTTVIRLTAIGEECVLARPILHDGEPIESDEGVWVLDCREWIEVEMCEYEFDDVTGRLCRLAAGHDGRCQP